MRKFCRISVKHLITRVGLTGVADVTAKLVIFPVVQVAMNLF